LLGKRAGVVRQFRPVILLSGVLVLFTISDFAFALVRTATCEPFLGQSYAEGMLEKLILVLWLLTLGMVLATWFAAARTGQQTADQLRIAAMIFLLAPILFALSFMPFITLAMVGYGSFWIGSCLVFGGLLKSNLRNAPSNEVPGADAFLTSNI
jgi:hypothetical protein